MATTDERGCAGVTSMLLLPQLVQIWLPDDCETGQSPLSEQAPRSRPPLLISFLERFPDVLMPDEVKGKKFPCGHVVSLRSILACCNFLGDATWTPVPYTLCCAQSDCNETVEFPKIPDPRVLDGLQDRLDLIQWSWNKDPATELDRKKVSLLRDILSRIGHLSQDPEPEIDANVSSIDPSESLLTRTLVDMELEAFELMVLNQSNDARDTSRGDQEYCRYRESLVPRPAHSLLQYPSPSPGQECTCVTPHEYVRDPSSWGLTPAETTEPDPDMPKDEKPKRLKTVRFVAPVVTEVQYFEKWWCVEYRDSGRYWSTGPHRRSTDLSTEADDKLAEISMGLEDQESDDSTLVEDDEVPNETEGFNDSSDNEMLDEDILDEMDRANEMFDDELMDDLKKQHEEWEEWF